MSLRIVLLTRSSRPSGAQMAWRLFQSGRPPVAVVVEKRGRMTGSVGESPFSILSRFGAGFVWKRVWEALRIRWHYELRKFLGERDKHPGYLSIEEWALDHPSVRVYEVEDHNSLETRELLWRLQPDVGVLTNTRKIQKEILEVPRHGFFNLHLSALPQYAGLDSIFWALFHGEKEIGVTVHTAAAEIDRGHIVLQRKIPVTFWDGEESLYEKALWLGTHLMRQALERLESGSLERKPQDMSRASYFSWPTVKERSAFRRQFKTNHNSRGAATIVSKRHILHLITRMSRGGAQENTLATVRGLRERGYAVTLVTGPAWYPEGEVLSEALEAGLEVILLPELVREIHPRKDLFVFARLFSLLKQGRFTLLHTHTSKAGLLGRFVARLTGIPAVVHTPHGHIFHSYFSPLKEKIFLLFERLAARRCDRLIALTEAERREHLELAVGRPEKWRVVPSGVNPKGFQGLSKEGRQRLCLSLGIPSSRKIVGYIGRLAGVKGARYFVEALPGILDSFPETHFVLVGDGRERQALEDRVRELKLSESVTFTGHREEVGDLLGLMDMLVVPSLNEGMGRVIVEAGFLARPVVATKVGGIPDLIEDGQTGILVPVRDSHSLAEGVIRLLRNPALGLEMGGRLREKVLQGFTEDQMIEKLDLLYQEVLKEKGIDPARDSFVPLEYNTAL